MIARTSSKVFHVSLNTMFPQTLPLNLWLMSWIAIWRRHQLYNCIWWFRCGWIHPKELHEKRGLSDVIFRFRCYFFVILSLHFIATLYNVITGKAYICIYIYISIHLLVKVIPHRKSARSAPWLSLEIRRTK